MIAPRRAAATLLAALALATGCGDSYEERAASACATARQDAGTTPESVARATRSALREIRALDDAPEAAEAFVQGLAAQQRALDALAAQARGGTAPAQLREELEAVDVQRSLLTKTAAEAGAPRCATLTVDLVQGLRAADYARRMRRFLAIFDRRAAADPPLRSHDLQRIHAESTAAQDLFDRLHERLEPIEPPQRLSALHQRFYDAVGKASNALGQIDEGIIVGDKPAVARAARAHRQALARALALGREVRAALPAAPDVEDAAVAAEVERDARGQYETQVRDIAGATSQALWDARGLDDLEDADAEVMGRLAAALDRQIRRLRAIEPPARAVRAQTLLLRGLRQYRASAQLAARLLRTPDAEGSRRLRALDRRTTETFDAARLAYDEIGIEIDTA